MRTLSLVSALLLSGCTYTLQMRSEAPGARVEGLEGGAVSLPTEVKVPIGPWVRRKVVVSAPSYRPVELDLGSRTQRAADLGFFAVLLPWRPRKAELDVVLVKEHGPSGTWTAEELGIEP